MGMVYVTEYPPLPPNLSLPVYEHRFGSRPKDIPFLAMPVPKIYRHEAVELLLLHHISPSFLMSANQSFPPVQSSGVV